MLRDYYKQMSDALKGIKKEGKVENIEIEEMNEENGYEDVEINYPQNKKFKTSMLKKGIIATAAAICLGTGLSSVPVPEDNVQVVEAATKKDKKKPVIKFSGKSKMTVEKNKSVKIPKTTAKDNKDGNVTKKIKITVKKGKKSYSKIAKAIKSNKKVKFTSTGKYVITYTVTDKAGNKATKKRYVTVVNKNSNDYNLTTEEKTTEATTEVPTTEEPTTEEQAVNLSDYADIEKVTVNGITYNVAKSLKKEAAQRKLSYKITSNNFDDMALQMAYFINVGIGENSKLKNSNPRDILLYFFGDVKLTVNETDYSNNIIFYPKKSENENIYSLQLLVVDPDGNLDIIKEGRITYGKYDNILTMFNFYTNTYDKLCNDDLNEIVLVPSPKNDSYELDDVNLKLVLKQ